MNIIDDEGKYDYYKNFWMVATCDKMQSAWIESLVLYTVYIISLSR